jgi:RNA polymerase sigma factor (sigma-70 family)
MEWKTKLERCAHKHARNFFNDIMVTTEDLLQVGMMAFIVAYRRSPEEKWRGYCFHKAENAMIDYLRRVTPYHRRKKFVTMRFMSLDADVIPSHCRLFSVEEDYESLVDIEQTLSLLSRETINKLTMRLDSTLLELARHYGISEAGMSLQFQEIRKRFDRITT